MSNSKKKSVGKVEPIAVILSRKNKEMSYSVIEFVDENLAEIHSSSLASILLSCGNEVALRNKYPELCSRLFDKDIESLDDISDSAEEYAKECNRINARRAEIEASFSK